MCCPAAPATLSLVNPTSTHRTLSLQTCVVDRETGRVVGDAGQQRLTTTELELLGYLVDNHGRTVTRQELLTEVWRYGANVVSRAPDDTMRRLRKKLEADTRNARHLVTVHGEGYRAIAS
jgi:DNA-binding response OmpR family regulator